MDITDHLWHKIKGWLGAPGAAPAASGTVLRSPGDGQPAPADPTAGALAGPRAWAAKSCTVYEVGQTISGRYAVEQRFEGGMGYVYIAYDRTQNLRFAIKQPKGWMLAQPDYFARVGREADAWTGLGMHPHVAYCYFVRAIEEVPHIFVEYVDGGTLKDWIEDGQCLDYRVGLELAIQCCHGMERAQARGLLHRDLKPANILMTQTGLAKVTDFGLVGEATTAERRQRTGAAAGETAYGTQMGTPEYMAPEQGRDPRRRCDAVPDGVWIDSDIYSFGVCLWELVCGRRPYLNGETVPPDPYKLRKDLLPGLADLLADIVDRDRMNRPQDFMELRETLNGFYRHQWGEDAPSYRIELPDTAADELNNQGYSYHELGKQEEALECFRKATTFEPIHPQATYNQALIEWRSGLIGEGEALRRLENCHNSPLVAQETLSGLIQQIRSACGPAFLLSRTGHTAQIVTLALSRDGRRALTGSWDKTLRVWDTHAGKCVCVLSGHTWSVTSVALSANAQRAVSASQDKTLKVWDLMSGTCTRTLSGHTHWIFSVAVRADGQGAISGGWDKTVKVWNLEIGECVATLEGHTDRIWSVALSADGRRAASGGDDEVIRIWDPVAGRCLRVIEGHQAAVTSVALSADARLLISGSRDNTVRVWDSETGTCLGILEGHSGPVSAIGVSEDGRWAVSGSDDQTMRLWDLAVERCARILEGHKDRVWSVALSGDGQWALSADTAGTVRGWPAGSWSDSSPLQLVPPLGFELRQKQTEAIRTACKDAEARLVIGDYRGAYDVVMAEWEAAHYREDSPLAVIHARLRLHGRTAGCRLAYSHTVFQAHEGAIRCVDVSPDGRWALSAGEDTVIRLWDLLKRECVRTLGGHTGAVLSVVQGMDGWWAVSGGRDGTIRVWDLARIIHM